MQDHLIRVADARGAIGELLPRLTGVRAAVRADAVPHEEIIRTSRRHDDAVHVLEESAQLTPALPAVRALQESADLDARVDRVRGAWIERDVLDVGNAGRRREHPLL